MSTVLSVEKADLIFGPDPKSIFPFIANGQSKTWIEEKTGHFWAVQNVNLSVNEGELFVLMGLSGSGKSSLLRCMNGLYSLSRGKVFLNDGFRNVDISLLEPAHLRRLRMRQISMVFQNFALMPWLSIGQNVAFGLEIQKATKEEIRAVVQKTLSLVGLEKWQNHYPRELSGGMQQRVGIARALATKANILLMDEPFSALDPLLRTHLQNELLMLQKELKKTIVFVSHDLDEAIKIGTRIAIMQDGHILQIGSPENIINHPACPDVKKFVEAARKKCLRCEYAKA